MCQYDVTVGITRSEVIFCFVSCLGFFRNPHVLFTRSLFKPLSLFPKLGASYLILTNGIGARYSVFWQLPRIRGVDNPMLEDEREAGKPGKGFELLGGP